jgi:hypothetical protein
VLYSHIDCPSEEITSPARAGGSRLICLILPEEDVPFLYCFSPDKNAHGILNWLFSHHRQISPATGPDSFHPIA